MAIQRLHHITLITADAQRNIDFYTQVLGLRFVKLTVNFDDPGSYHLYFADELAHPGTVVTFFEWRGAPHGRPGIGGTHHFAFTTPDWQGLLKWKRRLTDLGIAVTGPRDRQYFASIYFEDPDGTQLEITTEGPGWSEAMLADPDEPPRVKFVDSLADSDRPDRVEAATWPEPVETITADMALTGMHHISAFSSNLDRTHEFFGELLGMKRVRLTGAKRRPGHAHWFWGAGEAARPGTLLSYFEQDPRTTRRARMGAGQTHHFALAVEDAETQLEWREKLLAAGHRVSPVMDRIYFKSIYTNDPDGHIVELATLGPGFAIDESVDELGGSLKLPPWLERSRTVIEEHLTPVVVPAWKKPEPAHVETSHE